MKGTDMSAKNVKRLQDQKHGSDTKNIQFECSSENAMSFAERICRQGNQFCKSQDLNRFET